MSASIINFDENYLLRVTGFSYPRPVLCKKRQVETHLRDVPSER